MHGDGPRVMYFDYELAIANENLDATRDEVLSWIRDLTEALGTAPRQTFLEDFTWRDQFASDPERLARLAVLRYHAPPLALVRDRHGSWLAALVEAGVLEGGVRRTHRGTQVIGNDGCVCLSLGEAEIDNLLAAHGIAHRREAKYPGSRMRCDWLVGDVYIEYFGLTGDAAYDKKTAKKIQLAKAHGLKLVSIFPTDIERPLELEQRLLTELAAYVGLVAAPQRRPPADFTYRSHQERIEARAERYAAWLQPHAARGGEPFGQGVRFPAALVDGEGPAFVWQSGASEWYRDRQLHREAGPARYSPEGRQEWFFRGMRHRSNGPAEIEPKAGGRWYVAWYSYGTLTRSERLESREQFQPGWYIDDPESP